MGKLHEFFNSCQDMVASMNAQNAVGAYKTFIMYGSHYLNLESNIRHPNTDCMAREIVDVLFANAMSNQTTISKEFNDKYRKTYFIFQVFSYFEVRLEIGFLNLLS